MVLPVALSLVLLPAAAFAQEDRLCEVCHSDASRFDTIPELIVRQETHLASVHGAEGVRCVDCHADVTGVFPSGDDAPPHPDGVEPVDCATCHEAEGERYAGSIHGFALQRGNARAPTCADCHGTHDMRPADDPSSPTAKANIPATCAECHGEEGMLTEQYVRLPAMAVSYAQSVHGVGRLGGETETAGCDDCHGTHDVRGHRDPESPINRRNVSATCGECHLEVADEFVESIHGLALEAGLDDTPSCTDCHGEHVILRPDDEDAATHSANLAIETCGGCHNDPIIISKYNLAGGVVGSYLDSYHGWASRRGYELTANCVDCHTAHSVLPAAHPASAIHPDNVVATCGQCHEDASLTFAESYDHEASSITANPVNRILRAIYIVLIVVVIGGMLVHNLIIMNHYMLERRRQHLSKKWVLRLDRSQRIQHATLIVSFVTLVITGFALRYPDVWAFRMLDAIGMTEGTRATVHRIAGTVMIAAGFLHLYYILLVRRGREEIRAMLPRPQDVKDALGNMAFYTGRTEDHVRFGRYDYTHKAEYWALVWGTVIMALTGFVLWFPTIATGFFPAWIVGASQTIHFYEAWLATLAILVWHFFFVIFHPEEYPMNWAWLTGRLSEDAVREHHAEWYEEIVSTEGVHAPSDAVAARPAAGREGSD